MSDGARLEEPEALNDLQRRTLLLGRQLEQAQEESDRGLVLFLAAQMDHYLREIIESFLVENSAVKDLFDGSYAPFGSLAGKAAAAYFMGLISRSERDRVSATRRVRNVFAHALDADFDNPEVAKVCGKPPIFDERRTNRDAFLHMAMNTVYPLAYRGVHVKASWRRVELSAELANARSSDSSARPLGD